MPCRRTYVSGSAKARGDVQVVNSPGKRFPPSTSAGMASSRTRSQRNAVPHLTHAARLAQRQNVPTDAQPVCVILDLALPAQSRSTTGVSVAAKTLPFAARSSPNRKRPRPPHRRRASPAAPPATGSSTVASISATSSATLATATLASSKSMKSATVASTLDSCAAARAIARLAPKATRSGKVLGSVQRPASGPSSAVITPVRSLAIRPRLSHRRAHSLQKSSPLVLAAPSHAPAACRVKIPSRRVATPAASPFLADIPAQGNVTLATVRPATSRSALPAGAASRGPHCPAMSVRRRIMAPGKRLFCAMWSASPFDIAVGTSASGNAVRSPSWPSSLANRALAIALLHRRNSTSKTQPGSTPAQSHAPSPSLAAKRATTVP